MLKTQIIDNINVVSFANRDRINSLVTEPIKEDLLEYFRKSNVKMALDLKGIKFIDSSGFGVFLSVMKAANNNYGVFKICNVSDDVMELFKLLQLHNIFEIYSDLDDCIKSF